MQNIPDALKGEALLLWEAGQVFDLEPEDLSPFVGVSADRISHAISTRSRPDRLTMCADCLDGF